MATRYLFLFLFLSLVALPVSAQQSTYFIVSGPTAPVTAGEPWEIQDFWLVPPSGQAAPVSIDLFDAGLGSPMDLVTGPVNTTISAELIPFSQVYAIRDGKVVPLSTAIAGQGKPIASDESTLNRWITWPESAAPREGGWIFRLRATDGNDVNAFQIRLSQGTGWTLRAINLGLNAFGVGAGQEVQIAANEDLHPIPELLTVTGEEDSPVSIRDAFGNSFTPAADATGWEPTVNGLPNTWGVVVRGSSFSINNLVIRGSGTPVVFDLPVTVVTAPVQPRLSIRPDYLGDCFRFSLQLNNRSVLMSGTDVVWLAESKRLQGNPVEFETRGAGDVPVSAYAETQGFLFPRYWVVKSVLSVNAPPTAVINQPDRRLATGEVFAFLSAGSADPDGEPLVYQWLVDGKPAGYQQGFSFSSSVPGSFTVSLIVTDVSNKLGCNSDTASVTVRVNAPPFGVIEPVLVFSPGEPVTFRSVRQQDSDGDSPMYLWTGDGVDDEGTAPSVRIRHEKPGTYSVRLRVDDQQGTPNSVYQTNATYRVNAPPVPRFQLPVQSAPGVSLTLNANNTTDADTRNLAYIWKLSDGRSLSGPAQSITFERPGTYTVTLSVDDREGVKNSVQSISRDIQINAPPVPVITANSLSADGLQTFSAQKSRDPDHSIVSYRWEFGDGSRSTGAEVTHLYTNTGRYTIRLTVDDGQNQPNSIQSTTHQLIITRFPIARFDQPKPTEPGVPVSLDGSFSSDPDGRITSYVWTANGKPIGSGPQISFRPDQPGQYAIALQVTDDSGFEESTSILSRTLVVNHPPVIRTVVSPSAPAPGEPATFSSAGSFDPDGKIASVSWTFSDGSGLSGATVSRVFKDSGPQTAIVTVSDGTLFKNGTQSDTIRFVVNHSPIIVTQPSIRSNVRAIRLDASDSYDPDGHPLKLEWILPDGARRSEASLVWQAPSGGTHFISLLADDGQGRPNSRTSQRIEVKVNRPPVAVVDSLIRACTGQTILFSGSACYDPDGDGFTTRWDFGDSTTSTETNPVKVFYRPGTYQVTITLSDGFTDVPVLATIPVVIKGSPVARINFADTTICVNTILNLEGTRSTDPNGPIGAFSWDFGTGDRDFGPSVNYIFKEKGVYVVSLTVVGSPAGSCSNISQAVARVTVIEGPVADFKTTDWIAAGETLTFKSDSKAPEPGIKEWIWQITGPGEPVTLTGASVSHRFPEPGSYTITHRIVAEGKTGCNTASLARIIRVNAPPVIRWVVADSAETGSQLKLDASASTDPDGLIRDFQWKINGKVVGSDPVFSLPVSWTDSIRVSLTIRDESPTANRQVSVTKQILINQAPDPQFTLPGSVFEGQVVRLTPAATRDADGDVLLTTWLVNGSALKEPALKVTAQPQTVTLRQSDQRGFKNSVVEFSRQVTGEKAPVVSPAVPGVLVTGHKVTVQSLGLPELVKVVAPEPVNGTIRWDQSGNQSLRLAWVPAGETLKTWTQPVTVLDPLRFLSQPAPVDLVWNPANPSVVQTAPSLNRNDLTAVTVNWTVNGQPLGAGLTKTLPLKKGINRVTVTAGEATVPGSQPVTVAWEVHCN